MTDVCSKCGEPRDVVPNERRQPCPKCGAMEISQGIAGHFEGTGATERTDAKTIRQVTPNQAHLALDFFALATQFMNAYRTSPSSRHPDWPRYFQFCHAIELALKAFLAYKGLTRKKLASKKFGYNLDVLLNKTREFGLQLNKHDTLSNIALLNEAHTEYWPRYPRQTGKPVPVIDNFEGDAEDLFASVRTALLPGLPKTE
jgi:hypothetical protein